MFKCHAIITDGMVKEVMTGQEETGETGIDFQVFLVPRTICHAYLILILVIYDHTKQIAGY